MTNAKYIVRGAAVRRSAAQLNPFSALLLRKKGEGDGKLGIPKKDKGGRYMSPRVRRELDAHNQFDSKEWLLCERDTARPHIDAGRLAAEIAAAEREAERLAGKLESAGSVKMTRARGEERLSDEIIAARRRRELGINPAALQGELGSLERKLDTLRIQLEEILAAIAETENLTRLRVEKNANRTYARILSYWDGALRANADLPPEPDDLRPSLETSGEATYMARHYNLKEETA